MHDCELDITDRLCSVRNALSSATRMLDIIGCMSKTDASDDDGTIWTLATTTEQVTQNALNDLEGIVAWCHAMDMDRIEREKLASDMQDTDEGQALRNLSRDMARQIEAVCKPAMRAITEMQNRAGDIDAMVRRARDMAGCLKPMHHADRDPAKPEAGSLRAVVQEAMTNGQEVSA